MMNQALLLKVKQYVDSVVKNAIESVQLRHGVNGKDGRDGLDGRDGKDGAKGFDGLNGKDGIDGKDGKDGKDGQDGVSITDVEIDLDKHLTVTLSDGNVLDAGSLESLLGSDSGFSKYMTNTRVVEAKKTWMDYAFNWSSEPVSLGAVTGGEKFEYTFLDGTLYRFVPSPYVAKQDAFYTDANLTNLVVSRGGII